MLANLFYWALTLAILAGVMWLAIEAAAQQGVIQ